MRSLKIKRRLKSNLRAGEVGVRFVSAAATELVEDLDVQAVEVLVWLRAVADAKPRGALPFAPRRIIVALDDLRFATHVEALAQVVRRIHYSMHQSARAHRPL